MRRRDERAEQGSNRSDEAATVRFVAVSDRDGLIAVDCIVAESVAGGHLPPPGHPTTLPLLLPEPEWMSSSLRDLLTGWANADALVDVRLTRGRDAMVARLACADSTMSLALAGS